VVKSFYITTPIYYVNSTPHIGHAYTTIAADILTRHHKQRGEETFFLTGTDEHASKVYRVAEEQGLDAKTYVDQIAESWRELPRLVDADYDFFIRTTDDGHKRFVQDFIQRIYDNGHIYQDTYAGWYCVQCEEFKAEAELVDGNCPIHDIPAEWIEERNYFFRLSAFQQQLLDLYDERPDFVLPRFRYNEARSFIAGGLQDFSLSRAGQPWGVQIPWDPEQVVYVWVDALINYLSALTYAREGEDLREQFWPEVRHLLGKDILRFHCVFWPALLLAAGYDVPKQLFVHGFLQLDDRKISKSLGNVIDPLDLVEVYGSDAVRFWAVRAVQFGQDGNVTLESLHDRYQGELGNDLGNLVSRTTAMIARYRDGRIPAAVEHDALAAHIEAVQRDVPRQLDAFDVTAAAETIWTLVRALNKHVEETRPWDLAKDESRARDLDRVLYELADGLRIATVALFAYLPKSATEILRALGQPDEVSWDRVAPGRTVEADGIEPAAPLFPRVDAPTAAA
jgi:methionyl-tRNA synthetase